MHLSDIIARAKIMGKVYDGRVPPLDTQGWTATGLKKSQLEQLMQNTEEEFEKGKAFITVIREGAS